jgi:hypothetical protein
MAVVVSKAVCCVWRPVYVQRHADTGADDCDGDDDVCVSKWCMDESRTHTTPHFACT